MPSRSDQLQSYRFVNQRVVSALVVHDTDPPRSPFRGFLGAAFASVMVAIIAVLAVLAYGLVVVGGKKDWRVPEAIVVEKETGARYVYRDGVLYPVANHTSARLLGSSQIVSVSRNSLAGTPRGRPLGIPNAPEVVPPPADLSTDPWQLCAWSGRTLLLVGTREPGGANLADHGVLVTTTGRTHLIWHDRRYELRDEATVREALTWRDDQPVPVNDAWVNAIPPGDVIGPVRGPDFGQPSTFRGARAGSVYFVRTDSGSQYYVALRDGLSRITPLQADLLRGDREVNAARAAPVEIQASEVVASAQDLTPPAGPMTPPATTPSLVTVAPDSTPVLCAGFADGAERPTVRYGAARRTLGFSDTGTSAGTPALADAAVVPAGRGALVAVVSGPGATPSGLVLVTEPGTAYPLAPTAPALLGYDGVAPVRLPASLVARVPLGPALDPAAAALPIAR